MAISDKIYPRTEDKETVYLKNVVTDPSILLMIHSNLKKIMYYIIIQSTMIN